jgi:hypothetical protein
VIFTEPVIVGEVTGSTTIIEQVPTETNNTNTGGGETQNITFSNYTTFRETQVVETQIGTPYDHKPFENGLYIGYKTSMLDDSTVYAEVNQGGYYNGNMYSNFYQLVQ